MTGMAGELPAKGAGEGADGAREWSTRRADAAAEHVAARERVRASESLQARRLVEQFVREAVARGLRQTPLRARAYNGRSTYRTPLRGWYLKRNATLAVDNGANFYVMSTATSFRARIAGVEVAPADPPLVVGAGGRDGESMPLEELLRIRLEAGDDWTAAG
jgi:hypothetical protein